MSYLDKLLQGLPLEWKTLGEVVELSNIGVDKKKNSNEKEVRLLNFVDVFNNQYISNDTPTMIVTASEKKIIDCDIKMGDVFITPSSELIDEIGFSAMAIEDFKDAVYSYHIMRLRIIDEDFLFPAYLNFLFSSIDLRNQIIQKAQGITRFGLTQPNWKSLQIPIPTITVQKEIVRILDTFSELIAELTAELTARKKQYSYYREKLLSFEEGEVEWKSLGEVYKFQYGTGNTIPTSGGEYPVYGSNGIVGSHSEYNSEDSPVIGHIGAYAGIVNWGEGKHFVTYNGVICKLINEKVISRYAYHQLLNHDFNSLAKNSSQPFVSYKELNSVKVPIPSLEEQERIVSILDKFDTLTTSISEGLPKEIELRKKQYEYYRDLLLTFPRSESGLEGLKD